MGWLLQTYSDFLIFFLFLNSLRSLCVSEDLGLTASKENEQDKFKLAKSLIPSNVKMCDGSQPERLKTRVEGSRTGAPLWLVLLSFWVLCLFIVSVLWPLLPLKAIPEQGRRKE